MAAAPPSPQRDPRQAELDKARDDAAKTKVSAGEVLRYTLLVLFVGIESLGMLLSVTFIYNNLSRVLETAGSRLRAFNSITSYTHVVRTGSVISVLLDRYHLEFQQKYPAALELLQGEAEGDDPLERAHSLQTRIMADFVAPRLSKLDAAFVRLLTVILLLFCLPGICFGLFVDLDLRLSSLVENIDPDGPDDGTSVYRILIYCVIIAHGCVIFTLLAGFMTLTGLMNSCANIMHDIDEDTAARLLSDFQQRNRGFSPPSPDRVKNKFGVTIQPISAVSSPGVPNPLGILNSSHSIASPASFGSGALSPVDWATRTGQGKTTTGYRMDYAEFTRQHIEWMLSCDPSDMKRWWIQLQRDVNHCTVALKAKQDLLMQLLSKALHFVTIYLVMVLAMTNPTIQRVFIVFGLITAPPASLLGGYFTSTSRSYGIIVLADCARHINVVLGVPDAMESKPSCARTVIRACCTMIGVDPFQQRQIVGLATSSVELTAHSARYSAGGRTIQVQV